MNIRLLLLSIMLAATTTPLCSMDSKPTLLSKLCHAPQMSLWHEILCKQANIPTEVAQLIVHNMALKTFFDDEYPEMLKHVEMSTKDFNLKLLCDYLKSSCQINPIDCV